METRETYWSRFAADFDERNNYVAGARNISIIREMLVDQSLTGEVLELGCGNGIYTRAIASRARHLVATDLSEEMLMAAKNRLRDVNNITLGKQNCFSLAFDDSSFDNVVMINLLHVIPEPGRTLAESRRVLKRNGGIIVISFTMEGMSLSQRIGMGIRYVRTYGKPPVAARTLRLAEACELVEDAGFAINEYRLIGHGSKAIFIRAQRGDSLR